MVIARWSGAFATARLAQSAERKALNLVVMGSSLTVGAFSPRRSAWALACVYVGLFLRGMLAVRLLQSAPGRTRACNIWFRRPTPSPLGHMASRQAAAAKNDIAFAEHCACSGNMVRAEYAHQKRSRKRPVCLMDKAPVTGARDFRFEFWAGQLVLRFVIGSAQANRSTKNACRGRGSNRGPSDIQSDALPAELSRPC